jgi:hypothetical protein
MKHPGMSDLALFAGGDLPLFSRWLVGRHLSVCSLCQREISSFQNARRELGSSALKVPMGVNWDRLGAEIAANIHVGLDAGECIEVRHALSFHSAAYRLRSKPALVFAVTATLVIAGWFLVPRQTQWRQADAEAMVLETTPNGIEVKNDQRALTMMHPKADNVVYTVNTEGEMRARYVDTETGQVTINHVYVE